MIELLVGFGPGAEIGAVRGWRRKSLVKQWLLALSAAPTSSQSQEGKSEEVIVK